MILFGGDQLNQLLSDTWTFDGQKWEEKKPALAPAPRGGHALVWLPNSKKVLLLGGFGYDSGHGYYPAVYRSRPLEAWTYDAATDRWEFIRSWAKDGPPGDGPHSLRAAAGADDVVALLAGDNWLCKMDVSRPDATATAKLGVKPGTREQRQEWCDPQWYKETTAGDPAKTDAELAALPANTWVMRNPPKRPGYNVDWGSAVYAPDLDLIMRYSGGHCAYSGTAPQVYERQGRPLVAAFRPRDASGFLLRQRRGPRRMEFHG